MSDKPFPPISDETIAELRDLRERSVFEGQLRKLDKLEIDCTIAEHEGPAGDGDGCVLVKPDELRALVAVVRGAYRWRRRVTALTLHGGLPNKTWSELCLLDSEMATALAKITP